MNCSVINTDTTTGDGAAFPRVYTLCPVLSSETTNFFLPPGFFASPEHRAVSAFLAGSGSELVFNNAPRP